MLELTVYYREDCHLCDALEHELARFRQTSEIPFSVQRIDVDGAPDLARRYGHKVPVVTLGSAQVCHFFLDEDALRAELHNQAPVAASSQGGSG